MAAPKNLGILSDGEIGERYWELIRTDIMTFVFHKHFSSSEG